LLLPILLRLLLPVLLGLLLPILLGLVSPVFCLGRINIHSDAVMVRKERYSRLLYKVLSESGSSFQPCQ
ncbi:hypothetical protein, partial [Akkermansia sp.]|uniref:hypothetical protein n=1 Tax=Akkermansia sp. TaxID=1872421 RepID=UPI0025BA6374